MEDIFKKMDIDISPENKNARGFFRSLITEYKRNIQKYHSKEVQRYFHNFIAEFMLEYHKSYKNFDIRIPYRIKSKKSVLDKILDYFKRDEKHDISYNDKQECELKLKEDLTDMFALTIVGCNRPPTFYSNDPEINELIEEKKRNHALLGELQKFKLRITKEEFSGIDNADEFQYRYYSSKVEYYVNCIMVLERIKTLLNPNAKKLLKEYDKILNELKRNVPENFYNTCKTLVEETNKEINSGKINTSEKVVNTYNDIYEEIGKRLTPEELEFMNEPISKQDIKKVNLLKLIEDFTARIHDKLDLAVLTKQVYSVFNKSEELKKFGVEI